MNPNIHHRQLYFHAWQKQYLLHSTIIINPQRIVPTGCLWHYITIGKWLFSCYIYIYTRHVLYLPETWSIQTSVFLVVLNRIFYPWTYTTCMPCRARIKSPSYFQTLIDNIEMLKSTHANLDLLLYNSQEFFIRALQVIWGVKDQHPSISEINLYTNPMVPARI